MEPTLYIIMRSDIPDMNPGKGMAQAAHAQADFDAHMSMLPQSKKIADKTVDTLNDYAEWTGEGYNFGRTIVLSATEDEIRAISANSVHARFTVDPTYPWKNYYGELMLTKEITCGWIFVSDANEGDLDLVKDLPLHK